MTQCAFLPRCEHRARRRSVWGRRAGAPLLFCMVPVAAAEANSGTCRFAIGCRRRQGQQGRNRLLYADALHHAEPHDRKWAALESRTHPTLIFKTVALLPQGN